MARRAARRKKRKGVLPKITPGLPVMAKVKCVDNTGARVCQIIGVMGYKGRKARLPAARVGDMVSVVVKQGKYELLHKPMKAIVVRQRRPYRRKSGQWILFEDNAVILVNDDGTPKGTEVKGPIAKEAVKRWEVLSSISATVV